MADKKIANELCNLQLVAGVVHSDHSLRSALRLPSGAVDLLEIRVDAFAGREETLLAKLPKLKLPLIVTVRHPDEGGIQSLSTARRRELFRKFLPHAEFIDVELRSAKALADVIALARIADVKIIISHHDFQGTPSVAKLRALAAAARKAGASVFKVATTTATAANVATLLTFQSSHKGLPLSVMGMGGFGKISRLLFAQAGSVVNYGYLGEAQVNGQWPAVVLKKRLQELKPD